MGSLFARSTQHRIVEAGGREYRVPPASTRIGLLLYEALDTALPEDLGAASERPLAAVLAPADARALYHDDGHHDDGHSSAGNERATVDGPDAVDESGAVVADLLREWLPAPLYALAMAQPLPAALALIYELLDDPASTTGASTGPHAARSPREDLREIARADWDLSIADVADLWHVSPLTVLDAPFGAFLATASRLSTFEARRTLREGSAAALPYMTEQGLQALADRATGASGDVAPATAASPEQIAENRARLRSMFGGGPEAAASAAATPSGPPLTP